MASTDHALRSETPAAAIARARHWRRTRRLTGALLLAWFVVGFGVTWFARDLDFPFFGWPFSFWVAAQGGVIVFVALLAVYAGAMARVDQALGDAGGAQAADAGTDVRHDDPARPR